MHQKAALQRQLRDTITRRTIEVSSPQRSNTMKRFSALVLVCSLAMAFAQIANSQQTRPRRVNPIPNTQTNQQNQSSTAPQQTDSSSQTPRPSRPPVLGGANRNPNEQKPTTPQKDAGPEEVGEGDIVRVNTTLVSIPVSVMDRDEKFIPNLSQNDFRVGETVSNKGSRILLRQKSHSPSR